MTTHHKKQTLEIFIAGSIAIFLIVLIRIVFFQVFIIPSDSMYPTLQQGDSVLVLKFPFNIKKIAQNDVAVFNIAGQSFVKRVIGIENDIVVIENGNLFVNGELKTCLSYVFDENENHRHVVEEGTIYVLGDNNSDSIDSRDFGTIKKNDIVGEVFLVFSPISRFQFI